MRTAKAHGNAKALGRTHHHSGAPFPWRSEQRQRHQIGGNGYADFVLRTGSGKGLAVANRTGSGGVLQQSAKKVVRRNELVRTTLHQLNALGDAARGQQRLHLRQGVRVYKKFVCVALLLFAVSRAQQHGHGFACGRGLVQQRRVGQLHAGEVHHHGLVVQKRLHAALGNLRLVGRVGRVPTRIFQNVALDDRRRYRGVVAQANEVAEHLVLAGQLVYVAQVVALA